MVSLLDGDVRIIGSKFDDDGIEVGEGGTATIKSKGGDDHIYVWHQKAIVFNGGGGSDTIEFAHQIGGFDGAPIGAVIDLTAGTGTNPFGGAIKLKKVENVVGEFDSSNSLRGDKHDNRLNGGIAADTLRGEGGDDTIVVKYHTTLNPRATIADGGKGTDTLYAELSDASAAPYVQTGPFTYLYINILDLENPGLNTGTFHGGTFTNFEIFEASSQGEQRFDFRGSDAKETVLGGGSTDLINGRAGNDILDGAYGNDSLTGGLGKDVFAFHLSGGTGNLDTVTDFARGRPCPGRRRCVRRERQGQEGRRRTDLEILRGGLSERRQRSPRLRQGERQPLRGFQRRWGRRRSPDRALQREPRYRRQGHPRRLNNRRRAAPAFSPNRTPTSAPRSRLRPTPTLT